ncbi:MAG TPA: T9SS type A sorting domain-containing protein, partial [Flavisolibacter sp.]|nr:T9SS type A sorting domain-containing protein [Flavisolibacter sp.]
RYMQQTITTGLIRIDSNGVLDQTFNPYKPSYNYNGVTAMALQPDGKILIAGFGIGSQGYDTCGLIRLNKDGSLDNNFKPGSMLSQYATINVIRVQKNGKILIGGTFTSWKTAAAKGLVRLNDNGDRDTNFAPNGTNFQMYYSSSTISIEAIHELPDSSLLIGGNFAFFNGLPRMGLVKLLSDGNLDYSFLQEPSITLNGNFTVNNIAVTGQNKILLGGHFYISGNYYDLIALQSNGLAETVSPFSGPDPSQTFTASGISRIFTNPDNTFLAFGSFTGFYNGVYKNNLSLYNSQHQADPGFVSGFQRKGSVTQTIPQADNKIFVAGDFNQYDLNDLSPRQYIARLKTDGSLDASFQNTELNGWLSAIAQQSDSAILAVGSFTKAGSTPRHGIARFTKNGVLDPSFDPGLGPNDNNMYCVRPYKDQYIYVGGSFSQFAGTAHQGIARLFPDGSLDNSFITTTTPVYAPASIEVTSDGNVLAAESSDKTNRDYTTRLRLYKLLNDGKLDPSFQTPQLGWSIGRKVKEGKNGTIYWLGELIQQNTPNRFEKTLICLKPNGSLDSSARRLPSDYIISDFSILPDSNLVVCGQKITGVDSTNFILRLKPDLSIDSSFIPVALYYDLKHVNYTPGGNIVIAGETKRYFRFTNDQIQNVGLLRNSSMQVALSTGATTRVVSNIIDSISINQPVDLGSSSVQNFTAANPSDVNISLLDPAKILLTGPNSADFTVSLSNSNTVINKKGSLPFSITFSPKSEGKKYAVVTIPYSNGIDNKYSFVLSGTATNIVTSVPNVPGEEHSIYVYPNPSASGKVYIQTKKALEHYFIADRSGKKLLSGRFTSPNSENKEILIYGLKPGLYFIHLKGKKIEETVKLLVIE